MLGDVGCLGNVVVCAGNGCIWGSLAGGRNPPSFVLVASEQQFGFSAGAQIEDPVGIQDRREHPQHPEG